MILFVFFTDKNTNSECIILTWTYFKQCYRFLKSQPLLLCIQCYPVLSMLPFILWKMKQFIYDLPLNVFVFSTNQWAASLPCWIPQMWEGNKILDEVILGFGDFLRFGWQYENYKLLQNHIHEQVGLSTWWWGCFTACFHKALWVYLGQHTSLSVFRILDNIHFVPLEHLIVIHISVYIYINLPSEMFDGIFSHI